MDATELVKAKQQLKPAQSEYKHSLTFCIRRYAVISNETHAPIANPPNSAQLDGTPIIPPTYIESMQ